MLGTAHAEGLVALEPDHVLLKFHDFCINLLESLLPMCMAHPFLSHQAHAIASAYLPSFLCYFLDGAAHAKIRLCLLVDQVLHSLVKSVLEIMALSTTVPGNGMI